jgi:phosphoribosylaminoimidazole (AIR) synthetase
MGMGMIIIINKSDADKSISILGDDSQVIGYVQKGKDVEHSALL